MKRKIQYATLLIEAVLCISVTLFPLLNASSIVAFMAFPLAPLGGLLRGLSLLGTTGNGFAIAIYLLTCLAPCLLLIRKSKKYYFEDCLIILLSMALFFVLYLMINPSYITLAGGVADALPVTKAILCSIIYTIIFGYLVLRGLRHFNKSEATTLQQYLNMLLFLLNIVFIGIIFISLLGTCASSIMSMSEANSANEHLFALNIAFILLKFIVQSLPYAFNIVIVFAASSLLQSKSFQNAKGLARLCTVSIIVNILSNILFNFAQILFAGSLFNVTATVQMPLLSIIFVLACLLFAQQIKENAALKAENESFI